MIYFTCGYYSFYVFIDNVTCRICPLWIFFNKCQLFFFPFFSNYKSNMIIKILLRFKGYCICLTEINTKTLIDICTWHWWRCIHNDNLTVKSRVTAEAQNIYLHNITVIHKCINLYLALSIVCEGLCVTFSLCIVLPCISLWCVIGYCTLNNRVWFKMHSLITCIVCIYKNLQYLIVLVSYQ